MKNYGKRIAEYMPWLLLTGRVEGICILFLALADVQVLQVLAGVLTLMTVLMYAGVCIYIVKKEQKKEDVKKTTNEETKVSDSDTLERTATDQEENNTVEKAVEAPPLGALLDKRTEEIRNVIFTEMAQNGIPASLMDYMLTSILAEVRDLKAKEYSNCIISKEE